jgi:anti-sigma regulatory factor (Ser/Thr protein kinase)
MPRENAEWRPLQLSFPADDVAPGLARAAAAASIRDGPQDVDDAELLLTELVTNAVLHTGMRPTEAIDVRIGSDGDVFRVEVWDRGPGFDPDTDPMPTRATGGWGLRIVDELADRWGVDEDDGETLVWFEVGLRQDLRRSA